MIVAASFVGTFRSGHLAACSFKKSIKPVYTASPSLKLLPSPLLRFKIGLALSETLADDASDRRSLIQTAWIRRARGNPTRKPGALTENASLQPRVGFKVARQW